MARVDDITEELMGLDFPARKGDILTVARENHVTQSLMDDVEQLPDIEYDSIFDIWDHLGIMKDQDDIPST